jgi:nucleoside-diphosphate-sugar epimerase
LGVIPFASEAMKVLLTGANGFVGSHILDCLCAKGIRTAILLRPTSHQESLQAHLSAVEVHFGSLTEPASLPPALREVTHVIHCAGRTKARRPEEFRETNQAGTRHLVTAVNQQPERIRRFVHISSLAASHPATPDAPAREEELPHPVTLYGKTKLAAEEGVRALDQTEFVILRPAAVYGPRDPDFLQLFKAVQAGFCPRFGGGRQALSLVFVKDLAEVVVACLTHAAAAGQTYNVAAAEVVTAGDLVLEIARQMGRHPFSPPLPAALLWPICLAQEALTWLTRKPGLLSRQKYPELRAPGWVCDVRRLHQELGLQCPTSLPCGVAATLDWYRQHHWLR